MQVYSIMLTAPLLLAQTSMIANTPITSESHGSRFPGGTPGLRRFNSLVSMAFTQVNTTHSRNEFEDRIKRYGCHCFPGANEDIVDRHSALGSGKSVDKIDSVCLRLAKCHRCIEMRFGEDAIDVNNGRYHWAYDQENNKLDCSKNKDEARNALCECDASFAVEMGKTWDDEYWSNKFWLNNRNERQFDKDGNPLQFKYSETCVNKPKNINSGNTADITLQTSAGLHNADKCCGVGFMEPYNSREKQCCEVSGKIYNPDLHQCCSNGHIKAFGAC